MHRRLIAALLLALSASPVVMGSAPGASADGQSTAASPRFVRLLARYRTGDAAAAVEELSRWRESEVAIEAAPPDDDPWSRAATAMFLTDAGIRKRTFGRLALTAKRTAVLSNFGLDKLFEPFSLGAYRAIKSLTSFAKSGRDDRLAQFVTRWYSAVLSATAQSGVPAFEGLIEMAEHDFPDDALIRLFGGSVAENGAGPFAPNVRVGCSPGMMTGPEGCVFDPDNPNAPPGNPSQETLWYLRGAVKADPTLAEAHLRLGHMLYLLNRKPAARDELTRALSLAREAKSGYLQYFAELFLGRLEEFENNLAAAVPLFRAAVDAAPTSHTAHVALGEALVRLGDPAGWSTAREMFDGESADHPRATDVWFYYRAAQYWRLADDLRQLRDAVRVQPIDRP